MPTQDAQSKLDSIADEIDQQLQMGSDEVTNAPATSQNAPEETVTTPPAEGSQNNEPELDPLEQQARELGHLPYDEYVAAGHDPANWVGHKAFLRFRENETQQRQLRDELKETKHGVNKLIKRFESMTEQERSRHKLELEKTMAKAKESLDFNTYDQASQELADIKESEKTEEQPTPVQPGEHAVIREFRTSNPVLNKDSDQFNEAFNRVMESKANERILNLSYGGQVQLTDAALKQALDDAYRDTQAIMPSQSAPAKPARNSRKPPATGTPGRKPATADPLASLDKEAKDHYNFIKKSVSQRAADRFLKLHMENEPQ